jgi:hypothetical protein
MDADEIRLRLIEAACQHPVPHKDGFAAGVLESARKYEEYVIPKISGPVGLDGTLTVRKKAL